MKIFYYSTEERHYIAINIHSHKHKNDSVTMGAWNPGGLLGSKSVNTLRPRQNGRHFADDLLKCIFLNENLCNSIQISLKFVPKGPNNNITALVQTMAWCRPGNKPLSGPMVVRLPTHICVTRPQWVKLRNSYYKKRKWRAPEALVQGGHVLLKNNKVDKK